MSSFDWERFLKRWSQELLESLDSDRHTLPPDVIASGWLGYPGATEADIAQAETRLGAKLPPSYRAFLKVTNGWRQTTPFISRLWSTQEIDWFTVRRQDWLETLLAKSGHRAAEFPNSGSAPPSIPNEAYFVYGDEQDCRKIRVEYLQTALEISQRKEAAIYLLIPQVVTETGEWEAWFLGDWLPGADRYRSFQDMMQAEYESFLELREPPIASIVNAGRFNSNGRKANGLLHSKGINSLAVELATEKTDEKNPIGSTLEASDEWKKVASFTVEIQSKQKADYLEQRTVIHHVEAGTAATYPDVNAETVHQWILNQLNLTQPKIIADDALEATWGLEITQLRLSRAQKNHAVMVADQFHPLFPNAIAPGEPFTLEVSLIIGGSTVNMAAPPSGYRVQCFAYNLSTRLKTCLGDIIYTISSPDASTYTALFPKISLSEAGIYRLKVLGTLQNISASPACFKVPMLQVM